MPIVAVLSLCAAVAIAAQGVWALLRPPSADYRRRVLRAVAPIQLAAAVMLGAGGAVAMLTRPPISATVLVVAIVGAGGTIAAGCWQSAKAVLREEQRRPAAGCGGECATCTLSCRQDDGSVAAEVDRMGG